MTVVGNFNFSYFLRLMWEFLGLEIERGGFQRGAVVCKYFSEAYLEFFLSMFMPVEKIN